MDTYVLSIDQGTTGTTVLLIDHQGIIKARASREFTQYYPQPGWVEHDPLEILEFTRALIRLTMTQANISAGQIKAIGITNQRETTVVWDKYTGQPVCNAIVWQCRRTAPLCEEMKGAGWGEKISDRTGLIIDAYFSATKLAWILENIPDARQKARDGRLLFGTIDSWLLWNLSGGLVHATDYSNASRTMLYDIHKLAWDEEILAYLDIPAIMLPSVHSCSEVYGHCQTDLLGKEIPLAGVAGDQQAALFGQHCFSPGSAKNTYGTGCFLLMNTGRQAVKSSHGLVTTIAWGLNNEITYALEGSVFVAGAAVQWLRDEMHLISNSAESEAIAQSLESNDGVYMVPAFVGLGAPYWDMYARGTLVGLSRGTGRRHVVRAVLESIAYQSYDILTAMMTDSGISLDSLKVDGGACSNDFLMQFQADMLGVTVERPAMIESTALGAAFLAGLAVNFWSSTEELQQTRNVDRLFLPRMESGPRQAMLDGWKQAVACALKYKA
ncbi:MAG TPA: glycerol kinase GlpK [Syntrophomonas sp.]|nr:glycerol kinase GlpK [Syntrophomonas sp.]